MNIIFGPGCIRNPGVITDPNLLNVQNSLAPTRILFATKILHKNVRALYSFPYFYYRTFFSTSGYSL